MKAILLSALALVAVALVGCGGEAASSKHAEKPAKTGAAKWSDEVVSPFAVSKRDVYEYGKSICDVATPGEIAKEYNVGSREPLDLAKAWATQTYKPVLEQPAFEGCLAGLRAKA